MDSNTTRDSRVEVGFIGQTGLMKFAHLSKSLPPGTKLYDASGVERARTGWANPLDVNLRSANLPCGLVLYVDSEALARAQREQREQAGIPSHVLLSEEFARCVLAAYQTERGKVSECDAMRLALMGAVQTCTTKH